MQADVAEVIEQAPRPAKPSRRRIVAGGVAALVGAPAVWYVVTRPIAPATTTYVGTGGPAKGVGPQVDYEAPNFRLVDPSGKTIELKQFRGRPVLLNFWATWCAPCREEMPELEHFYRQYRDRGFVVLAVSVDNASSVRQVPEFLKEGAPGLGAYTFPVALDQNQEVLKQYKLLGVPSSFFIDAAGVIRVVQPRVMNRQMIMDGVKAIMPDAL